MKGRAVAVCFLLLALPRIVWGQSTLNFPKLFTPADLVSSGYAIANPGSTSATVTFVLYSSTGKAVTSAQRSLAPGTQESKLFAGDNQLFGLAPLEAGGWVQATSPTSGLVGFWLVFDNAFAVSGDGAEAASAATTQVIPMVAGTTELNIANPNSTSQNVQIELVGQNGGLLAPMASPPSISANGIYRVDVSTLFPGVSMDNARYIRITSTSAVASCAVVKGLLPSVPNDATIVNGVDTSAALTVNQLVFPHSISDSDWASVVGVTNLSSTSSQTVTITFTDVAEVNGVPAVSGTPVAVSRTLSPNGSIRENARDLFGFTSTTKRNGWVQVDGTQPLTGFVAYASTVSGGAAVVPVQSTPRTTMLFAHIADGEPSPWWTGLAFSNSNSTTATVKIYAMNSSGQLIGGADNQVKATLTLPPNTKVAKILLEMIPEIQNAVYNSGFIYVTSNVPIFASELFFRRDLKIVANVAAGVLAPNVTFTPPPPPPQPLSVTGFSPGRVARGGTVTISGTGFSLQASSNTVLFPNATSTTQATPSSSITTSMKVTVPQDAISGPLQVRVGGQTVTTTSALDVTTGSTALVQTSVSVQSGQTTSGVDIYVPPPAGGTSALNLTSLGVGDAGTPIQFATASVEVTRGSGTLTKQMLLAGSGLSAANGSTASVSGTGVTVTGSPQFQVLSDGTAIMFVTINIAANAVPGPRNVFVTNSNADTSVLTGALVIK